MFNLRKQLPLLVLSFIIIVTSAKALFLAKTPIFGDEALYCDLGLQFATKPFDQAFDFVTNYWKDAPGLPFLNAINFRILGQLHPIRTCRLTGVMTSGISSLLLYFFSRRLGHDGETALVGTLFLLLNPYNFFFDRTNLMDVPVVMWMMFFLYTTLRFRDSYKVYWLITTVATGLAMFLTKYNSLLIVPAALWLIWNGNVNRLHKWTYMIAVLSALGVTAFFMYRYTRTWETVFYHVNTTATLVDNLNGMISNMDLMLIWINQFLSPLFFLSFAIGVYILLKKRHWLIIFICAWLFLSYAIVSTTLFPRYLLLLLPFVAIVVAQSTKNGWGKILMLVLIYIFLQADRLILVSPTEAHIASQTHYEYFSDWGSGTGSSLLFTYLNSIKVQPGQKLIAPTDIEGLLTIAKLEYAPTVPIEFIFLANPQEFKKTINNYSKEKVWIVTTPYYESLTNIIDKASARMIYQSNGSERNSLYLYETIPN